MKKTSFIVLFLLLACMGFAQENQQKNNHTKVTSFSISFGFAVVNVNNSLSDYNALKEATENPDLFIDPNDYSDYYFSSGGEGNFSPKINIGLTPYSKKKGRYRYNREMRFGIGINSGNRSSFSFYKENSFRTDTLYTSDGIPKLYADSVITSYYDYSAEFTDINLSFSYLFKTNTKRRVYVYTGIGVEYGIAIRSFVNVDYNQNAGIYYSENGQQPDGDFYYGYYGNSYWSQPNYSGTTTDIKGITQFLRASIPLGIDFRISNNNSFFKHVNIYSEFNPGIELQMISGSGTNINPYFGVALVGLSYKWE